MNRINYERIPVVFRKKSFFIIPKFQNHVYLNKKSDAKKNQHAPTDEDRRTPHQ